MKKYSFVEYLAAMEGENFDVLEPKYLTWAKDFVTYLMGVLHTEFHHGDCTKAACSCPFCSLEGNLEDYKEYYFNTEQWRKERGLELH